MNMADKELTLQLPINPSPKALFRANAVKVRNHSDMIRSPVMKESMDVALLEYQFKLATNTAEQNGAAAAMFKIKGALEFIDEFLRLAEAPVRKQTTPDAGKIDHTV